MLTIQPIMNSIDTTNGKQSDDFQSANFNNADDDFGDFANFQESNKIVDDDFGDFTFFQSSINVNNTSNCNNGNTTTPTINQQTTTTTTSPPSSSSSSSITTTSPFSANGFKNDNVETRPHLTYHLTNETINDDFGDFTFFQGDNCDKINKSMDDDDFGDFTFFQGNDKSKLGTMANYNVDDKDNDTDGDLNFFSTIDTSENHLLHNNNKLDHIVGVTETIDSRAVNHCPEIDEDGEDDFGDFTDFQETGPVVKTKGMTDPTTSFTSLTLMASPTVLQSSSSSTQKTENESSSLNINDNNNLTANSPLSSIVCQSFAKEKQNGGNKIISTDLFTNATSQSYKMWQSLINWEEAASLKLNWESSHTFQVFLRSLKIDSNNIQQMPGLRDISTPLIPSKLTILQPTPLLPSIVPLEPQVSHQPHQLTIPSDSLNNSLDNNRKHQEQSASSIPEASFDWNSSGLTNPLEKDWLILL